MDGFNEAHKWDQAEQGPSHHPAEGLWHPEVWHVSTVAQAAITKKEHDISFPWCLAFQVYLKALQAVAYFLPCFCCAAITEEPRLTSAL